MSATIQRLARAHGARPRRDRRNRRWLVVLCLTLLVSACNFSGRPEGESNAAQRTTAPAQTAGGQEPGVYSAFPGDTVYGVAQRFGVPVRTLIETNRLKPPYRLAAGQRLQVPVRQEHVVQSGDTLFAISRIYGIDQSSLARANSLSPPYAVKPGQRLLLPGRVADDMAAMPEGAAGEPAAETAGSGGTMMVEDLPPAGSNGASGAQGPAAQSATEPVPESAIPDDPIAEGGPVKEDAEVAAIPDSAPATGRRFIWPVKGKVLSRFGAKQGGLHNDGINIEAPAGTAVAAADSGVVAYAGNELRGFGNLLLIRHADGWVTAYAHNDKILVKRGDKVKRGQTVARVGRSGNVAAPQLHFEIRKGTDPVDPLQHLGAQRADVSPAADPGARPGPG